MKLYFSTYDIAKGWADSQGLEIGKSCSVYKADQGWCVEF